MHARILWGSNAEHSLFTMWVPYSDQQLQPHLLPGYRWPANMWQLCSRLYWQELWEMYEWILWKPTGKKLGMDHSARSDILNFQFAASKSFIFLWSTPFYQQMGRCTTCECNGNVDSALGPVCNITTGRCLNCLNNTMGFECDLCMPGYFGDPAFGIPCRGDEALSHFMISYIKF